MLVEDDLTMLSLLNTFLEIEGFGVSNVKDFNEIAKSVEDTMLQVLIMDVHLDDADGIEALVEIREKSSMNEIGIIMSSGMDFKDECLLKGANDFILKPYMPDELISKIKSLMGNSS